MTAPNKLASTTKKRGAKRISAKDPLALQSPLKTKILKLAVNATSKAEDAKMFAQEAVRDAHECGRLLIAEKEWLNNVRDEAREKLKLLKENGQPATPEETFFKDADWTTWFDAQYARTLPVEIADRFVRLAKAHEHQTTFGFEDDPNVMRSGLLALHIYPSKRHKTVEGDVGLEKLSTHLAIVNRFVLWLAHWKRKHGNKISLDERARFLTDFDPIARFIDEMRNVKP